MNKIMLIGNLTRDPEMRSTPNGVSVCTFSIAIDRRFKNSDGSKQTDYIPIVAWRQLADLCGRYLAKGRKVGVEGSLQVRSYEDKQGNKRTAFEVVADQIEFLTPRGEGGGNASTYEAPSREEYPNVSDFNDTGFSDMDDSSLPF